MLWRRRQASKDGSAPTWQVLHSRSEPTAGPVCTVDVRITNAFVHTTAGNAFVTIVRLSDHHDIVSPSIVRVLSLFNEVFGLPREPVADASAKIEAWNVVFPGITCQCKRSS